MKSKNRKLFRILTLTLGFPSVILMVQTSHAASQTWDGGASTTSLNDANNWTADQLPSGSGDTATWDATVPGDLSLTWAGAFGSTSNGVNLNVASGHTGFLKIDTAGANYLSLGTVSIANGAGAFTLGDGTGTANVALRGTNSFTNNDNDTATIKSDITFASGGGSPRSITFDGSGNWLVDAALKPSGSGSFSIVKNGDGTLTLTSSNNSQTGNSINQGTLAISGSGVLGSASATLAMGGGTLDLGGSSQILGAATISSAAVSGDTIKNGSLSATSIGATHGTGNAIISANLLGSTTVSATNGGTLTLSGTNSYNGATTLNSFGQLVINGSNSGGGSYSFAGTTTSITLGTTAGTVVASSVSTTGSSNSRSLNLNGGILKVGSDIGTTNFFVINMSGGTLYNNKGSDMNITANGGTSGMAGNITVNSGGGTFDTTGGNMIMNPGTLLGGSGAINFQGGGTVFTGINSSGVLSISGNSKWDLNNIDSSVGGLSGSGTILNSGASAKTLVINGSTPNTFSGAISPTTTANIALTMNGGGTQILTGTSTYTGTTTIGGGSLQLGDSTTTGSISAGSTITNNGNLTIKRSNTVTQGIDFGTISSGTGSFTQAGAGTTTLNVTNSYSGGTTVSGGILAATASGALGSGTISLPNAGGRLQLSNNTSLANAINLSGATNDASNSFNFSKIHNLSGNNTISGDITWNSTGGLFTNIHSSADTLTLSGNLTTSTITGNRTFNFAGDGDFLVNGTINNGSATVGISKVGDGTLTLGTTGSYNYAGNTTVTAGTLVVNGNISTSVLTTVESNGTLKGIGTVSATLINGTFAPGNSIGTINIAGTLSLDGIADFEIDPTSGLGLNRASDLANVSGTVTYGGILNVLYGGPATNFTNGMVFNLFDAASFSGNFTTLNLPTLEGELSWENNLTINGTLVIVPEPKAALLGGLGLLMLIRRKRSLSIPT